MGEIYSIDNATVPAQQLAIAIGLSSWFHLPRKYVHGRTQTFLGSNAVQYFVRIDEIPQILQELDQSSEEIDQVLRKLVGPSGKIITDNFYMGEYFKIVPPFSTAYSKQIYVFADNTVSAYHFAKMIGLSSQTDIPLNYVSKAETKYLPSPNGMPVKYFVKLCDFEAIMKHFGKDPADLRKIFPKEKKLSRKPVEAPQKPAETPQKPVETPQKPVEAPQKVVEVQIIPQEDQEGLKIPVETPQSPVEALSIEKKRDREEQEETAETPDEFIKLFAKRYIKEHPDKAKEYIVEKLINNKLDDLMKSLA